MKHLLLFLCSLLQLLLSAQDYTIAVKPDPSGQIYLQTDTYCGMSNLQWQVKDNAEAGWQDMPGADSTILALSAAEVDSAQYRCEFLFLPYTDVDGYNRTFLRLYWTANSLSSNGLFMWINSLDCQSNVIVRATTSIILRPTCPAIAHQLY